MSVRATVNPMSYDALTELRAASAAAMTSDTNTTALSLDVLAAYWNTDLQSDFTVWFVIEVSAYTAGASDVIANIVSAVAGDSSFGGTLTTVASRPIAATGRYIVPVDKSALVAAASKYLRVNFDLPATGSPSITAAVYVSHRAGM